MAVSVAVTTSGCGDASTTAASTRVSCDDVLDLTIELIRAGEKGDGDDPLTDAIELLRTGNCPEQYEVFADYSSAKGMNKVSGATCADLVDLGVNADAIELVRQDGLCGGGAGSVDAPEGDKQGSEITWDQARDQVGTKQRVCGPLAGAGQSGDDVFLNLGRNYPDPKRFQIVVWDVGSVDTPRLGQTLCATGRITQYRGVAQIELRSASDFEVSE